MVPAVLMNFLILARVVLLLPFFPATPRLPIGLLPPAFQTDPLGAGPSLGPRRRPLPLSPRQILTLRQVGGFRSTGYHCMHSIVLSCSTYLYVIQLN